MTYWKFAPGEQADNWDTQRDSGYIGIGWSNLGNMLNSTRAEYDRRREEIGLALGVNNKDGNSNVWKFIHDIKIGDTIIANRGQTTIIGIGVVTGDPYYIEDANNNYPTRRAVEWRYINNIGVRLPDNSINFAIATLHQIRDRQQRALVDQLLSEQTNSSTVDNRTHKAGYTATQSTPMNLTNIILYGPPGTGKTHALTSLALSVVATKKSESNHFDYAQSISNGTVLPSINREDYQTWHSELQKLVHAGRVEFTTFHQNYAYEDFVEGLKAELDEKTGTVHYKIEPGILKRIAYRALYSWLTGDETDFELDNIHIKTIKYYLSGEKLPGENPDSIPNYVLIIDEINRGNVARIFGELITLVEDSKRACREITPASQPVFATLPYTKERFILPPNLHIIGTMNTADRSLIGLDAALRRRFDFIELPPRPELLSTDIDGINLQNFLSALNQRIQEKDTRDHCIGHAYFMAANSFDDIQAVMRRKVIPQLQEYFHDRPTELTKLLSVGDRSFVNDKGVIDSGALVARDMYTDFAAQ